MNDSENNNLERLKQLSSELASVDKDLVTVEGAGLPTGELEQRSAGLILELIELNPDLTPGEKVTIKKEIKRYGISKVIKDLGILYSK